MHYFQFNIGDYASHTRHLSLLEDLAYRRMLDSYYLREEPLPESAAEVARLIGMREHIAEIEQVLSDFFELTADGWRHARADREIAGYARFLDKQRENGKRGGRPRNNPDETQWKPTANPTLTQTEPKKSLTTNHKPLTTNQEPITPQSPPRGVVKPDDVSDDVWRDFKKHRAKHGGITDRVIAGFRREAAKAGWTLEQAMDECMTQGWRGFKAEYVKGKNDEQRFSSNSNTYRLAMQKLGIDPDG
jgi:uncharacterized protein YdaU (DUF1376 family)